MTQLKKTVFLVLLSVSVSFICAHRTQAAISNWEKAVSVPATGTETFSSDSFKQSVQNAQAANANTISLITTYYTANCQSANVDSGWNTASTASLQNAIAYIHSLGMRVNIKPHLEAYDTWGGICTWRANITPSDRNTFFANYESMLKSLFSLNPDSLTIGSELISVSSNNINSDNTARWKKIISDLRAANSAVSLDYSANWGSGSFATETNQIQFWGDLNNIGISGYYELPSSTDAVSDIQSQWDHWNQSNIAPLASQYSKPVQFTEIGYESVNGARYQPWDFNRKWWAGYNGQEQANLYTAMFQYWNNQTDFTGVNLWDWEADPNAGYPGNTDYTPQHKPAQDVIAQFFAGGSFTPPPPPPTVQANFAVSAAVTPSGPTVNQQLGASATVKNNSTSNFSNTIVDLEVRDANNNKVSQQFYQNQNFAPSQSQTYTLNWTPTASGNYKIAVGVFNSDWSQNYIWDASAASFTVGDSTSNPPPPPPPTSAGPLDVWWPTDGTSVSGTQPFKAMVENLDISQYNMYWQVDGDVLNQMSDSSIDYPHKESLVDLTSWNWQPSGNYGLDFIAKDLSANVIAQKSITIHVTH